ncbi:MAG: CDP-alcohol phosphatidyltransferase family protein [Bacillota bacterium]|jgi:Phosphatidylglycerophosphate synthase|nr:CDP-diacylglycerol--glycerol-3-phosphate 3-phosphatidyltransferase [Bacillota bacterium]
MNVPNLLTLCRFALVPLYLVVFFSGHPYATQWAFVVLLTAGLTDIIDGYLARKYKQVTDIGIMLDPLADKLMMIAVILSFVLTDRISWLAAGVFFVRDIGMIVGSALFHLNGKKPLPANALGKATTVMFYITFLLIMFDYPYAENVLWAVIAFSFVTSFNYLIKFKRINAA